MCGEFGRLWRINFNPTKSVIIFQNLSKNDVSRDFYLNGIKVQKVNCLFYLDLPIGDHVFKENYWDEKFKKVQKALYSSNGVGCRAFGLEPKILARLYSIYCQPIFNYGIEICHIEKTCIIKRNIGLLKFTKNTALLEALKELSELVDLKQMGRRNFPKEERSVDQIVTNSVRSVIAFFRMKFVTVSTFIINMRKTVQLVVCQLEKFAENINVRTFYKTYLEEEKRHYFAKNITNILMNK
ncbi:hypothetical protein BpHYR1_054267 [Brachionus plicatilis]|uniref:RNA-directed DNA polymerase from mobile element jockey-like n=1 Tax=Brachionus plicatilis TaxID=10195 RepID=A0A3M7R5Z0_BRAPC|nr:hypothetical protein BpHYR1_054267 [Brachionus plicatilis]